MNKQNMLCQMITYATGEAKCIPVGNAYMCVGGGLQLLPTSGWEGGPGGRGHTAELRCCAVGTNTTL